MCDRSNIGWRYELKERERFIFHLHWTVQLSHCGISNWESKRFPHFHKKNAYQTTSSFFFPLWKNTWVNFLNSHLIRLTCSMCGCRWHTEFVWYPSTVSCMASGLLQQCIVGSHWCHYRHTETSYVNHTVEWTVTISQVAQFKLSSCSTHCCHNFSYFCFNSFSSTGSLIPPILIWLEVLNMHGQSVFFPLRFLPPLSSRAEGREIPT